MPTLQLDGIHKSFGDTKVVNGVDLKIDAGQFLVLVGPSGCGKSTLLRMIAGLESPTRGTIQIGDKIMNQVSPKDRGVAMVFQNYALYPHMSVRQNIGFALKLAGANKTEVHRRVSDAAERLGITDQLHKKPGQLSGGQKQRVAIGRALVRRPEVFLFDEPLSNLDAQLRVKMRAEIAELHRELGVTSVYVTHDQTEAMTMADQIAILNKGRIEQFGPPMALYRTPATKFVAAFIGTPAMNFFDAERLSGSGATYAWIGIRPEHLNLTAAGPASAADNIDIGAVQVALTEPLGSAALVHCDHSVHGRLIVETRIDDIPLRGQTLHLSTLKIHAHFFGADGKRCSA